MTTRAVVLLLALLILVGGALGGFSVYTWGWRDDHASASDPSGDEAGRARAYGVSLAAIRDARFIRVERLVPNLWAVVLRGECFIIDLNKVNLGDNVSGVSDFDCDYVPRH
jgi:hypothetical protein